MVCYTPAINQAIVVALKKYKSIGKDLMCDKEDFIITAHELYNAPKVSRTQDS